ncbi:hypothetical protein BRADI_4g41953v3 [Brachypodium distachyon]|uniref:AIPP2-like SPOC-like domain-containing protein n=1 Tax=Brachypodium distachyon TaxID=15368 RepID=A0A0Q3F0K1_BRADI|nr:hypothetical protein BRADI_4g41953v3 [Brachypodium distachyon]
MKRTKPHDGSDSKEVHNNCKLVKRGKYIYEDNDDGDQNILGAEVATDSLTTSTVVMKDRCTEVSNPLVLESSKVQEHSDLPIDEPIWSGDFKLGSKGYGSLAAHLSAKHCEKVWKISKLLRPVVEVTKLPRLEAWPKSFEASRPIDESIALYFLPHEMRHNVGLDQLVKEVTENDMVLRAVVEEAEMLIFPSILLPERHQTFKGKPYPWAVFKRREDKVATPTLDEEGHVIDCCARAEEKHASPRKDHRVTGLNMGVESEEVERQVTKQEQTSSFARPKESRPSEGTACPTQTPTIRAIMHANHGQIPSWFGVSQGVSTGPFFGFIAGQTPRLEKLIKEMQSEGAVVFAMRGEMIGSGLGQGIGLSNLIVTYFHR